MIITLNNPLVLGATGLLIFDTLIIIFLFWKVWRLPNPHRELGEEGSDLAALALKHKRTLAVHNKNLVELGEILEELVENNRANLQKIGLVRFNPFGDTGGNLSFALCLLDGKDNGFVVSSLHGRAGTRMYAKPIIAGQAQQQLTEEEQTAIAKAKMKNQSEK